MYNAFWRLACEQALLFGRVKRVSRERASERRSGCHFSNLRHVCGDSFHALRSPGISGVEMKIYERWLQALLSSAPRSRVLARLASLAQIGELARRLNYIQLLALVLRKFIKHQ